MITFTKIRELDLSVASAAGRPFFMSAASGLVCRNGFMYVIADDELHLGVYPTSGTAPGDLIRVFDGVLPDPKPERKKKKPDFEGLTMVPPFGRYAHGALLAIGSGSRRNRRLGALLEVDADGATIGRPHVVDLAPVFAPLETEFDALNIEGIVVSGDTLRLLQRGNKRQSRNAIVTFHLPDVLGALNADSIAALKPVSIHVVDLGTIDGTPLGFTDGAALPDGALIFTAVAEDTDDPYDEGPCAGAAIGIADSSGQLRSLERLDQPYKVEGVHAREEGDSITLLLVTDADDPAVPASLYTAKIGKWRTTPP